mmetsp:Transcript_110004/g.354787  ORF Transcript_110004/g.354787 Transcript_110004/m.354787 type:complete len:239 (-) Transcript_110004:49-765(-)
MLYILRREILGTEVKTLCLDFTGILVLCTVQVAQKEWESQSSDIAHERAQRAPTLQCALTAQLVPGAGSRQTQHAFQLRLHIRLGRHLGGLQCLEVIALLEFADFAQHLDEFPHLLVHAGTPLQLGSIDLVDKPCRGGRGLCANTLALPLVGFLAWPDGLARLPGSLSGLELGTLSLFFRLSGLKLRPSGLALRPLLGDSLQPQEGQRLAVLGQVPCPPATWAHHRRRSAGHRNGGHY